MTQLPKPQLDRVLAKHYGFTDEELDLALLGLRGLMYNKLRM